ncbi:Mandelamide hydrolase [Variovorax sp. SRS16]|uniref:indoleacetamide hydrolase n=1 Tax=Variovorax sp. SRS16 TaxID=282217 RepID=UPI001317AEF9|nr:indoleacetamide hydrolase [Variovorax sp. SRS16]VTU13805.1 Mandelamide hydrolase [Variovorax sp. SRS16]
MNASELGIVELQRALAQRDLSCADHVEALIARTEAAAGLNGYVDFDPAPLRAQARQADAQRAAGTALPLLGIPIALKDNIDTADLPTSAGTGALRGKRPKADAEIVRRLKAAGAIVAGKANMHELAFGITCNNAVTGAARNPWAPDRIPGGSSGGSAVVVAAGLVPAAIGTDTGASVRLPAALCGVAGLRPTVGRVPGRGIAPIASTRDTAGPIARSVADLALLDAVLTGDATPVPDASLAGLRLGIPRERFWGELDAPVAAVMDDALQRLRAAGAVLVEVALPGLDALNDATGFPVALFEFLDEMPRYLRDAGHGVDIAQLLAGIGSPDVAGILRPLLAGGAIPEAVYRGALETRGQLQRLYRDTFESNAVRALVFPTSPLTARPIGQDETVEFHGRQVPTFLAFIRNTDPGSNAGIPGISLPAGIASDGLPVGLALDAPAGSDRQLLGIAAAIERVLPRAAMPSIS